MANPVAIEVDFRAPETPRRSPIAYARAWVKERWTDEWKELVNVRIDAVIWCAAPSMPRAQITLRYGWGILADGGAFQEIHPAELQRQYLKIEMRTDETAAAIEEAWYWYGIIDVMSDAQDATVMVNPNFPVVAGERTFMAYGLESLLDRHRIDRSFYRAPDTNGNEREAKTGLTFNEKNRGNRELTKSKVVVDVGVEFTRDYFLFAYHNDEKKAQDGQWSTRDIVEYLIKSGTGWPKRIEGEEERYAPEEILHFDVLDDDLKLLPEWDSPELESHLVSSIDIFNTLISRRRLLTWWLWVEESTSTIYLRIASLTDAEIELPAEHPGSTDVDTLKPNTDWANYRFDKHWSADVIYQKDTSHSVDQVVCYGARRTNTWTAEFGVSTADHIKRGWDLVKEQPKYELGGSDHPLYPPESELALRREWHAIARSGEDTSNVFRRFVLRETLDYPPTTDDDYKQFFGNVRILPTIPFYESTDYGGYKIANGLVEYENETNKLERRPPLILIEVPNNPNHFVELLKMGRGGDVEIVEEADVRDWGANIRIPADGQSIQVDIVRAPQHTIAFGDFKPRPEDEIVHGHWDWKSMKATICVADDRFCEGRYPKDDDVTPRDFKRIMRIPCGENYKLDWVKANTIANLDAAGVPILVDGDGFINDNRPQLENIARTAYGWYSQERIAIRIRWPWDTPVEKVHLGQFVRFLHNGIVSLEVFSAVTEIEVFALHSVAEQPRDLPPMQVTIHTAFGELDFLRLHSHGGQRSRRFKR
jgi:hypothetical protein